MSGGTLPATPKPAKETPRSNQPTRVSLAHSLKRQARTRGAQRWEFKRIWPKLKSDEFWPLYAFLISQRGQADLFQTTLSGHETPRGTWSGSPVVNGAGQTGRSVNLRGLTASQAAAAKAGDLIKFINHSKVYMVTADAASNISGLATVSIEPALIAAIADGEALVTSNVPLTVARASDVMDYVIEPGVFYSLEVELVEAW